MKQYDVYRNPFPKHRASIPFLLILQNDLLDQLSTRLVAPLILDKYSPKPLKRLNPVFSVRETKVVLSTQEMGAVDRKALKDFVASLAKERERIVDAIDVVFSGI